MGCKKQEKLLFSSKEIQETLLQNFHCYVAHVDEQTYSEQHSSTYGAYYRELQIELFETEELPNFLLIQHDGNLTIHKKVFHSVKEFNDWLELAK
jgi:thioredoxin-related protein